MRGPYLVEEVVIRKVGLLPPAHAPHQRPKGLPLLPTMPALPLVRLIAVLGTSVRPFANTGHTGHGVRGGEGYCALSRLRKDGSRLMRPFDSIPGAASSFIGPSPSPCPPLPPQAPSCVMMESRMPMATSEMTTMLMHSTVPPKHSATRSRGCSVLTRDSSACSSGTDAQKYTCRRARG